MHFLFFVVFKNIIKKSFLCYLLVFLYLCFYRFTLCIYRKKGEKTKTFGEERERGGEMEGGRGAGGADGGNRLAGRLTQAGRNRETVAYV